MGAAMGWTVHDVKRSSMWEFFAAWHGYVDANSSESNDKLTDGEADDLFDWLASVDDSEARELHTTVYCLSDDGGLEQYKTVQFTLS